MARPRLAAHRGGAGLYRPLGAFRYALEARAGFFEEHGIEAGRSRLLLTERGTFRRPATF